MKTTRIQKLIKTYLLPTLSGFSFTGRMMFAEPVGPVLRGFYFEDSSFSQTALYVWVFVQPLYVPAEHVHFTFGRRLMSEIGDRKNESWEIADEVDQRQIGSLRTAISSDGLPYLGKLASPDNLAENLEASTGLWNNPFVCEAVAYSLAKCTRYADARTRLQVLVRSIKPDDPWCRIKERAEKLLILINEDPPAVQTLLADWISETAQNLRLPTTVNTGTPA